VETHLVVVIVYDFELAGDLRRGAAMSEANHERGWDEGRERSERGRGC
jgi:hypothetical protein